MIVWAPVEKRDKKSVVSIMAFNGHLRSSLALFDISEELLLLQEEIVEIYSTALFLFL